VKGEERTVEGFFRLENSDDGLSHAVLDFGQGDVADDLKTKYRLEGVGKRGLG